ncbi:MAG: sugar transferase [Bacteroidetes bacterium]|jgi:lipopolysaccharide/colanic/teichoic acid biosynthesis glycosyltransferase|nr:sugar transferase [Bacteroidota bacterium]
MKKRHFFFIADLLLLFFVFGALSWLMDIDVFDRFFEPYYPTTTYMALWFIGSFLLRKNRVKVNVEKTLNSLILKNIGIHVTIILLFYYFEIYSYKWILLGAFFLMTVSEMLIISLLNFSKLLSEVQMDEPNNVKALNLAQAFDNDISEKRITDSLQMLVIKEIGDEEYKFVERNLGELYSKTLFLSTSNRFNILQQPNDAFLQIINLKAVNRAGRINKLFEAINSKLPIGGKLIGYTLTPVYSKQKILRSYPEGINRLIYYVYYVWQNVFPKVYFLREIYFIITTGKFRELSKAETFGRLYSCGFDVIGEKIINGKRFFVAEKIKEPIFDENPTYGPLISLKRYGKNGKLIKVYKLRSMYPFAEYLQDYVYRHNDLEKGGKFKNDFRVTSFGKIIRKLWLDELPMFLNVLKGEMKIVGVRPLSKHYFNLYSKELQQKRIQHKPGLIPPFYVDMPKTLEEIMASEMKYLEDYEKNGLLTDWKYFWKALYNIIIKRARSQ